MQTQLLSAHILEIDAILRDRPPTDFLQSLADLLRLGTNRSRNRYLIELRQSWSLIPSTPASPSLTLSTPFFDYVRVKCFSLKFSADRETNKEESRRGAVRSVYILNWSLSHTTFIHPSARAQAYLSPLSFLTRAPCVTHFDLNWWNRCHSAIGIERLL